MQMQMQMGLMQKIAQRICTEKRRMSGRSSWQLVEMSEVPAFVNLHQMWGCVLDIVLQHLARLKTGLRTAMDQSNNLLAEFQ
jgi:hypothetical protein